MWMWNICFLALGSLVLSSLLAGSAHAQVPASGKNDSACVSLRSNTLFNQCNYTVDVGFCVVNPKQTKNFFDSSDAFRCPNGGMIALGAGRQGANILHGTVHWWACSTKTRGGGRWQFVQGSGYRGHC